MLNKKYNRLAVVLMGALLAGSLFIARAGESRQDLQTILPRIEGWKQSEKPESYLPANLFEYINGAAEIYLSYDFEELLVGQFVLDGEDANVSVEIYDMGNAVNAFGIYGAERFPENKFISMGTQGYLEDDVLNFLVDRYYVKLMCFDCGEPGEILKKMAASIVSEIKDPGGFPEILAYFPKKGRVANSEKFNLKNVMGYSFLSRGYLASYNLNDMEFDCFIIDGGDENLAAEMLRLYLDKKSDLPIQKEGEVSRISDRYYDNIFITRTGSFLCGVMKIKDGKESVGREYLAMMVNSLSGKVS